MKNKRLYRTWVSIRRRCNNKNTKDYKYYGGKGIRVSSDWDQFSSFEEWAISHGYSDTMSIDRIDSNKDYCPENCRWITFSENDSRAHKGQIITPEQRKNISEKLKDYYSTRLNPNAKKIKCIETGVIYNSVKEASLSLGLNKCAVQCSTKKGYRCGGYHWEYI